MVYKLTFKSPKLHAAGTYTIKVKISHLNDVNQPQFQVISEHGEHCSHFDLKIGPAPKVQKVQKTKEQAKAEEEADEAFKKRMARM